MNWELMKIHLAAAHAAGRESACGVKFQHSDEAGAHKAAAHLNARKEVETGERHRVEAYPCPFCSQLAWYSHYYWHVGREMTEQEREYWLETTQQTPQST